MADGLDERGCLPAGEREPWAVRDVDEQDAVGREQGGRLAVELDARDVRGGAGAAEDVDDDEVDRAAAARAGSLPSTSRASP